MPIASRKAQKMRGAALLSIVMLLLTLSLLYLTGSAHQLLSLIGTYHQQSQYLKSLNNTLSALALAPYLPWHAAGPQWQCHTLTAAELCLKQSSLAHSTALLRVCSPISCHAKARVTQYRFVYQNLTLPQTSFSQPIPANAPPVASPTLFWIPQGWFDLWPEKEIPCTL